MQSLRADLNSITRTFGPSHTVLIDISYPSGRFSRGEIILEKVSIDKKEKYSKLVEETSSIRDMHIEIIMTKISSRRAVHVRSLEVLRNLLLCNDKEMKRIRRRLFEEAIMGSMEIW
jgi:hypothetical protein